MVKKILCLVLCVLVLLSLCSCDTSRSQYKDAVEKMDSGDFQEALMIFKTIPDYKESQQKIEECELALMNIQYEDAVALMNNGKYAAALMSFKDLGADYLDSSTYIGTAKAKLIEELYLAAIELKESGLWAEAHDTLKVFQDMYYDHVIYTYKYDSNGNRRSDAEIEELLQEQDGYKYYLASTKDLSDIIKKDPTLANVGDSIFLGMYEQDNDLGNGAESIEWIIVDKDEQNVKLAAKYVLDTKPYHDSVENAGKVTWETCSIRQWLNEAFFLSAFSEEEQQIIQFAPIKTWREIDGKQRAVTVEDRVFLDDGEEEHWDNGRRYSNAATPFALANGAETKDSCCLDCNWWTVQQYSSWGAYWKFDNKEGIAKLQPANGHRVYAQGVGVRPFIWVKLEDANAASASNGEEQERTDDVAKVLAKIRAVMELGVNNLSELETFLGMSLTNDEDPPKSSARKDLLYEVADSIFGLDISPDIEFNDFVEYISAGGEQPKEDDLAGLRMEIDIILAILETDEVPVHEKDVIESNVSDELLEQLTNGEWCREDLTGHDSLHAIKAAETIVKSKLKSPATAIFCSRSESMCALHDNKWIISGWVDAENGFGETLRNEYMVSFSYNLNDDGGYVVYDCIVKTVEPK